MSSLFSTISSSSITRLLKGLQREMHYCLPYNAARLLNSYPNLIKGQEPRFFNPKNSQNTVHRTTRARIAIHSCTYCMYRIRSIETRRGSIHNLGERAVYFRIQMRIELDLQSLMGSMCKAVLIGLDPAPLPPHLGSYKRALLVS